MDIFYTLLILHIAGGSLGLMGGTMAAVVVKGKKWHLLSGKLFSIGMITAGISALIISNLPGHENLFLFTVGGFTLYMTTTGYRVVWLKRNAKQDAKPLGIVDYLLFAFGVCFGLFLLIQSIRGLSSGQMFAIVPGVFGLICLNYARMDYNLFSGKHTLKQSWMANHITRMMGALIASYTAFLVVNVQIGELQWILWLLPSLAGGILIGRFLKKFAPRKIVKPVQNIT